MLVTKRLNVIVCLAAFSCLSCAGTENNFERVRAVDVATLFSTEIIPNCYFDYESWFERNECVECIESENESDYRVALYESFVRFSNAEKDVQKLRKGNRRHYRTMCQSGFVNSCDMRRVLASNNSLDIHPRDVIVLLSGVHLDSNDLDYNDYYPDNYDPRNKVHFLEALDSILKGAME